MGSTMVPPRFTSGRAPTFSPGPITLQFIRVFRNNSMKFVFSITPIPPPPVIPSILVFVRSTSRPRAPIHPQHLSPSPSPLPTSPLNTPGLSFRLHLTLGRAQPKPSAPSYHHAPSSPSRLKAVHATQPSPPSTTQALKRPSFLSAIITVSFRPVFHSSTFPRRNSGSRLPTALSCQFIESSPCPYPSELSRSPSPSLSHQAHTAASLA